MPCFSKSREVSGSHIFKITGFSKTKEFSPGQFVGSDAFAVADCSWAIRCYPNGDCKENQPFTGLFVELLITGSSEVRADFDFLLLDQRGRPLWRPPVAENPHTHVNCQRPWGYPKFIRRSEFEASQFYRYDCLMVKCKIKVFFIKQSAPRQVPPPPPSSETTASTCRVEGGSHTFKIVGYSLTGGLGVSNCIRSGAFTVAGCDWVIRYHPDGDDPTHEHIGLFLELQSQESTGEAKMACRMMLLRQDGSPSRTMMHGPVPFASGGTNRWGSSEFIKRSELEASPCLKHDCFTIKCDVFVLKETTVELSQIFNAEVFNTQALSSASNTVDESNVVCGSHVMKIVGHSQAQVIGTADFIASSTFAIAGYNWSIRYYPHSDSRENDGYIGLRLELLSDAMDVCAIPNFKLLDQNGRLSLRTPTTTTPHVFRSRGDSSGEPRFMERLELEHSPFLIYDSMTIKCDVIVIRERPSSIESPQGWRSRSSDWAPEVGFRATTSTSEVLCGSHTLKVAAYSQIKGFGAGGFITSDVFTLGGHDWVIRLYPDGHDHHHDTHENGKYMSVLLALVSEANNVMVKYSFTTLDPCGRSIAMDPPLSCPTDTFSSWNPMWGFQCFLQMSNLEESRYLKDDCFTIRCTMGIIKESSSEPSTLTALPGTTPSVLDVAASVSEVVGGSYVYEVTGYSQAKGIDIGIHMDYGVFSVGGHDWIIRFYPGGITEDSADDISIFLMLVPSNAHNVKVKYDFWLVDQDGILSSTTPTTSRPCTFNTHKCFWGHTHFMKKSDLEASQFLKDDSLRIKCTLSIIKGPTRDLSDMPPPSMHEDLRQLLESGEGADVTFDVSSTVFTAHRIMLAARSSVFRSVFFGPSSSNGSMQCIQIDDMEPAHFKALLHFIYTDTLPETGDITMTRCLLVAADRYALQKLKLICEDKLCKNVTLDTWAASFSLSEKHNCLRLKSACIAFAISPENITALRLSLANRHCSVKELMEMLGCLSPSR